MYLSKYPEKSCFTIHPIFWAFQAFFGELFGGAVGYLEGHSVGPWNIPWSIRNGIPAQQDDCPVEEGGD